MKKILYIVIFAFVISSAHSQKDNPLKEGMPNTIKLRSGEVIYDLNGEWDAVYEGGVLEVNKDIVKITQIDNQFIGTYLLYGDGAVGKNMQKVKGKLKANVIDEIFLHEITNSMTRSLDWIPSDAIISEDGNEIKITSLVLENGATKDINLSLNRKLK